MCRRRELIELGVPAADLPPFAYGGAYINSLAFRSQGAEVEIQYQLGSHLFVRGGYTYTDAIVKRSFSIDNLQPSFNTSSNFSALPIGADSPLVGARPFRIAPHTEGVSAYPREVTRQMVLNFLTHGAAINVLAQQHRAALHVVDVGVDADFGSIPGLFHRKVRGGTRNMLREAAMSQEEVEKALYVGYQPRTEAATAGHTIIAIGEMGIGNTTAARQWSEAYPDLPAPGGELFEAFQSRVLCKVKHLLAADTLGCAPVVTHAGVMRVVLRSLCGLGEQEAWEQTKAYCRFFRYRSGRLV